METLIKSGWRDPLQGEPTAYDILGLAPGATASEIEVAFRAGVAARGNAFKLTGARRTLHNISERALLDVFFYIPRFTQALEPNPFDDPDALKLAMRMTTAEAWEDALRSKSLEIGIGHSLAVLWYWSACFAEEHNSTFPGLGRLELWENTIAYWAMVIASSDFWSEVRLPEGMAAVVRGALIDRVSRKLEDLSDYRMKDGAEMAASYSGLSVMFANEIRVAELMVHLGIRARTGPAACGPLMLKRIGMLDGLAEDVALASRKDSANASLKELAVALSPLSSVDMFIRRNKPDAALAMFDQLPLKDRTGGIGVALRGQALYQKGKQQVEFDDFQAGLHSWSIALRATIPDHLRTKIVVALVAECQTRVGRALQRGGQGPIQLLEDVIRIADEPKLRELLAHLLTNQGVQTMNNCLDRQGSESRIETIGAMKTGMAMLERAAKLGSRRATDQLKTAHSLFEQFAVGDTLRQAHEAAERQDWDAAIGLLSAALRALDVGSAASVKQNLAVCYGARAVAHVNRLAEDRYADPTARAEVLRAALQDLKQAVVLDPTNRYARENLAVVEALISGRQPPSAPHRRPLKLSRFITTTWLWVTIVIVLFVRSESQWLRRTGAGFAILYALVCAVVWFRSMSINSGTSRGGSK